MPRLFTAIAVAGLAIVSADARADAIHDCVEAANGGQSLRDEGKLTAARKAFVRCSADACPTVVRQNCQRWDAELAPRLSTITFAATGPAGEDRADVRVTLDGVAILERLDGRALSIDPGPHDVVLEKSGLLPWKQRIVVREGEKDRVVTAKLVAPASAPPPSRSVAPLIASGSVAGVGLGAFVVFGLVGQAKHDQLASTCAPTAHCSPAEVRAGRDAWIAADVSLTIGVTGAVVFTALLLPRVLGRRATAAPSAFVGPTGFRF